MKWLLLIIFLTGCKLPSLNVYRVQRFCDTKDKIFCEYLCETGKYNFSELSFDEGKKFQEVSMNECNNIIGIKRKDWYSRVRPEIIIHNWSEKN